MNNYENLYTGKYLKVADLDLQGPNDFRTATIVKHESEEVGFAKEKRAIIHFDEKFNGKNKPMILNTGNYRILQRNFGTNPDNWIGKKVELFSVWFNVQGQDTESLKIRIPAPAAPQQRDPAPAGTPPVKTSKRGVQRPAAAAKPQPEQLDLEDAIDDIGRAAQPGDPGPVAEGPGPDDEIII